MKKKLTMFLAGLFLFVGSALAQTKVSGTVLSQDADFTSRQEPTGNYLLGI